MTEHYWVITPEVTAHYQDEPPESFKIVDCVEANSKKEAKVIFVSNHRAKGGKYPMDSNNWFHHLGHNENPFRGLKVESCVCEHGYCNCDLLEECPKYDKESEFDYCRFCVRASDLEFDPRVGEHCDSCETCKLIYKNCEVKNTLIDSIWSERY